MIKATLLTADGSFDITSQTWRDEILKRGYEAFIFDCDGTLVESADVHFASFCKAAEDQGFTLDRNWYLARTGLDRISLFKEFARTNQRCFDVDAAVTVSISRFIEISDQVQPVPEVKDLVQSLWQNYPLAVGTNAEKPVAEASLRATEILRYFDHIVAVSDGLKPKPSPEIFSRAAKLLCTLPSQSLVIEDSHQGVSAARAAGIDVIEIMSA